MNKRIRKTIRVTAMALLLIALGAVLTQADPHPGQSVNVVIIGGTTLDTSTPCSYYGSGANVMGYTYGGCLPVTGPAGELGDFTFTAMAPSAVSAASLAAFDTAILNVASVAMGCNTNTLTAQQQADLVAFAGGGKKLIIFDSECYPGPVDYSWMPFPFSTANPGALGARGTLTIVEENTLSSNYTTDAHYIDAAYLGSSTDAVGDMNVMTTFDANWCVDASGTNAIGVTGPVHTYAKYPPGTDQGLIIYNGLDQDYLSNNEANLRKMWVQELQQPFNPSGLPCGITVVGITLTPVTAENEVGENHTVTAQLTDLLGNPQTGIAVTFNVTAGPNAGTSGTCSVNADCTTYTNGEVSFTYTGDGGVGTDSIQACFTDQGNNYICSQTATKDWIITNQPPVADANGPYFGDEGSPIGLDGTGSSDPDVGDTLSYSWSVDSILCTFDDATSPTPALTCTDNGDFIVTLVVDDGQVTDSDTADVTVYNVAPTVGPISVDSTLVAVGTPINASAGFTDPGTNDTHTAQWDWGDGTTPGTVTQGAGSGSVDDSHIYSAAGVYTIILTVTDDDGDWGQSVSQYVVVYDPDGGFVTGGGWIDSPAGACRLTEACQALTGKATFGFVSKYKERANTPTGNTEFQFHAGDLNFHSDSYQWLVIAGPRAKYKGTGTINGTGNYGIMLTATDEKLTPSTDVDLFRIKIWDIDDGDAVVYDNQMSEADDSYAGTALGSGSIVIHKK
jgi:PKD domain-containing protein